MEPGISEAQNNWYKNSRYSYLVKPIPRNEVRGLRGKPTGGCPLVGSMKTSKDHYTPNGVECAFSR